MGDLLKPTPKNRPFYRNSFTLCQKTGQICAHQPFFMTTRKAAIGFIFITLLIDVMGWG